MRGHEAIIRQRMSGTKPPFIFINDYPCQTDWFEHGDHATVCTAGDTLSSMDFRFLVGTKVSISAASEARAKAIFNKAKTAGAVTVAACHVHTDERGRSHAGWTEIYHKEI